MYLRIVTIKCPNQTAKKAFKLLNWKQRLTVEDTVLYTASWYKSFLTQNKKINMHEFSKYQIKSYLKLKK